MFPGSSIGQATAYPSQRDKIRSQEKVRACPGWGLQAASMPSGRSHPVSPGLLYRMELMLWATKRWESKEAAANSGSESDAFPGNIGDAPSLTTAPEKRVNLTWQWEMGTSTPAYYLIAQAVSRLQPSDTRIPQPGNLSG